MHTWRSTSLTAPWRSLVATLTMVIKLGVAPPENRALQGLVLLLLLPPLLWWSISLTLVKFGTTFYQIKNEQKVEHKIMSFVKIKVGWPAGHSLYQTSSSSGETEDSDKPFRTAPRSAVTQCPAASTFVTSWSYSDVFMDFRQENLW